MDEFDPIPRISPVFRGLVFAGITVVVGLAAWTVIGAAVVLIMAVLP